MKFNSNLNRRRQPGHWPSSVTQADWQRACTQGVSACLASMQSGVDALLDPDLAEPRRAAVLAALDDQTRRLNRLVRRLLAWQDTTSLAAPARPVLVALRPLLTELVAEYQALNPGHHFSLSLPDGPVAAPGSPATLQLVFELLIDNALRGAPADSEIRLEGAAASDTAPAAPEAGAAGASGQWVFQIRSPGAGLAPEALAKVFDDPSQAGPQAVYGLGISFAQQLVETLGGRMWVDSQINRGATFSFSLPSQIPLRRWNVPRPRVLVIDNDAQLRAALKSSYEEAGYEVVTASTGVEGVELADQFEPQLVLLEGGLKPWEGKAIFAHLRERCDAAIVLISAEADKGVVANALWQGATDYVAKPFHVRELLARTAAILRRRHLNAMRAEARATGDLHARADRPTKINPLLH